MSDISEIPTTETSSMKTEADEITTNMPENVADSLSEEPSDSETVEVGAERTDDINRYVEETLNNPQDPTNSHLIQQLQQPEAQDPKIGKEQLLNISYINEQIRDEGESAKEDIEKIAGIDPNNEEINDSNNDGGSNEAVIQEEEDTEDTIEGDWKWVDEDMDPKTVESLINNGDENLTGNLSPEELKIFEELKQLILDRFPPVGSTSSAGLLNNMLDSLPKEEKDTSKEAIKILLRIGVRLGTRIAAFIADEIVKSADKDDKATKFIFGSIRDAAKGFESAADTAITGEAKPERLTKNMRDFMFGKKQKS